MMTFLLFVIKSRQTMNNTNYKRNVFAAINMSSNISKKQACGHTVSSRFYFYSFYNLCVPGNRDRHWNPVKSSC